MKKLHHTSIIIVFIMCTMLIFTGCDKGLSSDIIQGTWYYEDLTYDYHYTIEEFAFTKIDDITGTYEYVKIKDKRWRTWDEGTYVIEEDKVVLTSEENDHEYSYLYQDGKLIYSGHVFKKDE